MMREERGLKMLKKLNLLISKDGWASEDGLVV